MKNKNYYKKKAKKWEKRCDKLCKQADKYNTEIHLSEEEETAIELLLACGVPTLPDGTFIGIGD